MREPVVAITDAMTAAGIDALESKYHDVVDLDPWEPVVKAIYAAMEAARLASAQTFHEAGC